MSAEKNMIDSYQSVESYISSLGKNAKNASMVISQASNGTKNLALRRIAEGLMDSVGTILAANKNDIERSGDLSDAFSERMQLDEDRVRAMASGLVQVAALPDPVGEITDLTFRPSGIQVGKMRVQNYI